MSTTRNAKLREYSISQARRCLPSLIRDAEAGEAVRITRRGQPVAVILGQRAFERLVPVRRDFGGAYEEFLRSRDLEGSDIDPDELFRGGAWQIERARDLVVVGEVPP